MKTIIIAKDKEHLESLVEEEMTLYGIKAQMNTLSNPQYYDNGCTNISNTSASVGNYATNVNVLF